MNFDLNRCLNNFFQKIIGDTLSIRLITGNDFTIILHLPYRFVLYCFPCSLYFSVGNWFCEGAQHYPHWLWIELLHYSGQKDLLLLVHGDLKCECCILPSCHREKGSLYFKSDKWIKSNKIKIFKSITIHIHKYVTFFI